MKNKLNFNSEELIALFKLVKEYYEKLPEDIDDCILIVILMKNQLKKKS